MLKITAESYFKQLLVTEIIAVDDDGSDETETVLQDFAAVHPGVALTVIKNPSRLGASQSRNIGANAATNPYVLFCDDDELLEPGYAQTCLSKLQEHEAAAVSGRRVYMLDGETPEGAVGRFGHGFRGGPFHRRLICEYVNGARFEGDLEVPFTNAVILTRRDLLLDHPFDPFYARGNGYREETDFQMNLYTKGHKIIVTNQCHSIHLPMSVVSTGGQRTSQWRRIAWSIYYTRYFFAKYYSAYANKQKIRSPMWVALSLFSVFAVYRSYLKPLIYPVAMGLLRTRASLRGAAVR